MGKLGFNTSTNTSYINMKFLVLASCIAVSSAQLVSYPNGAVVPADEPAVAAVRASHLAAHGNILPHAGLPYTGLPYAGHQYAAGYAGYPYVAGYVNHPFVAHPNGAVVPADEPAVVAARADHLAAHGAAYAAGYPYAAGYAGHQYAAGYAGYPYVAGYVNHPFVAHPNGAVVPADEPAVVAARAEHLAAHGAAYAGSLPYGAGVAYAGLVAHPNGAVVPAEPLEVVAARSEHLAAHGIAY